MRKYETAAEALAAVIRGELAEQQQTVEWLSEKSGIPYGTLRRYYAGKRGSDLDAIFRIAAALGIPAAALLARVEAKLDPVKTSQRAVPIDPGYPAGEIEVKLDEIADRLRTKRDTQDTEGGSAIAHPPAG